MGKSLDTRFHFLPSNFGITCLRNHFRTICVIIVKNITFERFPFLKPKAASEHITHWQKCIYLRCFCTRPPSDKLFLT